MPRIFLDFFVENFCNNRFAFIFNQQTTRIVLFFRGTIKLSPQKQATWKQ